MRSPFRKPGDAPEGAADAGTSEGGEDTSAPEGSTSDATLSDASSDAGADATGLSHARDATMIDAFVEATVDTGPDAGEDASDAGPSCPRGVCPVVLASASVNPWNLAVNASAVYWTETGPDGGRVMSVGFDGGAPVVIASNRPAAWAIALNGTSVYWSQAGSGNAVWSAPLAGGPAVMLATAPYPNSLAVGGGAVYWASPFPAGSGTLMKLALEAGALPETIASDGSPFAVAVDATNVYWTESGSQGGSDGMIWKAPLAGGPATMLASGQPSPAAIATDGAKVYWANGDTSNAIGAVMQVPVDGGTPVTIAAVQPIPHAIAVDGTNVYWSSTRAPASTRRPLGAAPRRSLPAGWVTTCPNPGISPSTIRAFTSLRTARSGRSRRSEEAPARFPSEPSPFASVVVTLRPAGAPRRVAGAPQRRAGIDSPMMAATKGSRRPRLADGTPLQRRAQWHLHVPALANGSVGTVTFDGGRAALVESSLSPYLAVVLPSGGGRLPLSDAVFYANCLAYEHDVPVTVWKRRGKFHAHLPLFPGPSERDNFSAEILVTETMAQLATARVGDGGGDAILFHLRCRGDEEWPNLPYMKRFVALAEPLSIYATGLRQLDPLGEFLHYYRVLENADGKNGKHELMRVLPLLLTHSFGRLPAQLWSHHRAAFKTDLLARWKRRAVARLAHLVSRSVNVADHLYSRGRCGIAHGKTGIRTLDAGSDLIELARDVPLVKMLARVSIDSRIPQVHARKPGDDGWDAVRRGVKRAQVHENESRRRRHRHPVLGTASRISNVLGHRRGMRELLRTADNGDP